MNLRGLAVHCPVVWPSDLFSVGWTAGRLFPQAVQVDNRGRTARTATGQPVVQGLSDGKQRLLLSVWTTWTTFFFFSIEKEKRRVFRARRASPWVTRAGRAVRLVRVVQGAAC
jgi:hypothetical protein